MRKDSDPAWPDCPNTILELFRRPTDAAPALRVDGVSPDGAHRERSVAVRLPKADVVALGRRYQQSAVFWFDGGAFWLLGAEAAAEPQRLPAERRALPIESRPS
jgi:hypothetical protein